MAQNIIGVTGNFCSGKDTVAKYLTSKGFFHLSLSDLIRDECRQRGLYNSRDDLVKVGNELRQKEGNGVLAKIALKKVGNKNKLVITSIRNLGEVEELKKTDNFIIINVDAPIEVRFKRAKNRGKVDDQVDFQKFKKQEELEKDGKSFQQQVDSVINIADYTVINDGLPEELYKKVDQILEKIL